jgi:hypothetical protein
VLLNGQPVASMPQRDDGLMEVPVPQGHVEVTAEWMTTADMWVGRWLSFLSVLLLTGLWWMERKRHRVRL